MSWRGEANHLRAWNPRDGLPQLPSIRSVAVLVGLAIVVLILTTLIAAFVLSGFTHILPSYQGG